MVGRQIWHNWRAFPVFSSLIPPPVSPSVSVYHFLSPHISCCCRVCSSLSVFSCLLRPLVSLIELSPVPFVCVGLNLSSGQSVCHVCLFVSCSKFSRWREWNTKINLQHSQNTVRIFPSINRDIWWKILWYLMIFCELTVKAAFACFVILNLRLNRNTVKSFLISKCSIILSLCASSFTILL